MAKAIKAKAKVDSQTIVSGDCRQAIHWYASWLVQQSNLGALTSPWISSSRGLFASNFEADDQLLLETTLSNLESNQIMPLVITGEDLYKQADNIWQQALQRAKFGQPAFTELETKINNCPLLVLDNLAPPASAQQLWYLYHYVLYPRALAGKPIFISTPLSFDEFVIYGAGCEDFEYSGRRLTWEKLIALLNGTMLNLQQAKLLQAENLPVMLASEYNLYRAIQERHLNIVCQQNVAQYVLDFGIIDEGARVKLNIECDFVHRFIKKGEPQRDAQLIKDGWQILHLSQKEITGNLESCVDLIEDLSKGGGRKITIGRCCNLPMLNYQTKLPVVDNDQLSAIAHAGGPAAITGGAGTGKSACIAQRIAFLIGQGASPERLLIISHSPETVQIIKATTGKFLTASLMDRINFYAWHDLGLRILKEHVSAIQRKLPLKVETNSAKVLQKLIAKYSKELDPTALELCGELDEITAAKMISLYKANLVTAQAAKTRARNEREELLAKVYFAYEDQMQKANKIDRDDMVSMAANVLGEDTVLRSHYQNLFEHVIVDEYQDATAACDFFARLLAFPNDNLIIIGNEDESIHEQAGAAPQLLPEVSIRAPEMQCYILPKNWRAHPEITKHAEQFAKYMAQTVASKDHIEKNTVSGWGEVPAQAIVGPNQFLDVSTETNWIADQIEMLMEQGRSLGDMAIICRTRDRMLEFSEVFTQRGLVVNSVSPDNDLVPDEAADVLAFLKLVVDPDGPRAREYFERVCQLRSKPIAAKLSATILSWAESFNLSYLKAVEMYAEVAGDPDCIPFGQLIERIRDMHHNKMPPTDIIRLLKMPQWLGNYYQSVKLPVGTKYEPLVAMTEMEDKARIYRTAADFIKSYSPPDSSNQQDNLNNAALNLLSVAEAKGREFQIAFLPSLVEGIWPDVTAANQKEEQRLFYVCLTRARELLYLSCYRNIGDKECSPSPFLSEMGLTVESLMVQSRAVQTSVQISNDEARFIGPENPEEPEQIDTVRPEATAVGADVIRPHDIEDSHEIIEEFMEPQVLEPKKGNLDQTVRKVLQAKPVNQCGNCQMPIEKNARFCGQCGAVQTAARLCPSCGAYLQGNEKFCGECGTSS